MSDPNNLLYINILMRNLDSRAAPIAGRAAGYFNKCLMKCQSNAPRPVRSASPLAARVTRPGRSRHGCWSIPASLPPAPASRRGEYQPLDPPVRWIRCYLHQAVALQRLEIGGEAGAVHREQVGDRTERRRPGPVERIQQRELAAGDAEAAKGLVEAARQRARRALRRQTQAMIAHEMRLVERNETGF